MTSDGLPEYIGPFRVDGRLGSGGMGRVLRAWDERLHRWVAIKSIHPESHLRTEYRERLRREARAVAGLNHPAVTQVYDILTQDETDYVVMELVEGASLAGLMVSGPLPVGQALVIARQIAGGLDAAHRQGLVHRDLKAENVLVTPDGQLKILDFGLAKRFERADGEESLTADGVVMGTTRAMSPEQAQGRQLDPRSDLFALGSLLYEMLSGRHPFQASSPIATMERVVRHHPLPVRRLRPEVPAPVELLVARLLEKDPDRRPECAREVADTLDAVIEDRASGPPPVAAPERPRWMLLALLAAALVALVATIVVVATR